MTSRRRARRCAWLHGLRLLLGEKEIDADTGTEYRECYMKEAHDYSAYTARV